MEFTIYTPQYGLPDPAAASPEELKKKIIPAVFAEFTIDNTGSEKSKRAFFGHTVSDQQAKTRHLVPSMKM